MIDDALTVTLARLVPEGVGFDCGPLQARQGPLFPEEENEIARAVTARKQGFRAGRTCARAALKSLGVAPQPILAASDRRPLWPAGALGSITHSSHLAAAIAGREADFTGLGVDLEPVTALEPGLVDAICRPEERTLSVPGLDVAKLVFVIKEAFYKAYYPQTRQFLDFPDACVSLDPGRRAFSVTLTDPAHPAIAGQRTIAGRWDVAGDHFIAVAAIAHQDAAWP